MESFMKTNTNINFDWKYSADFKDDYILPSYDDSSFKTVQIPHANIEVPYNNFDEKMYQFESCYRKKIWIDSVADNEKVYVKFEAVMTYAKVYLNGVFLGEHKGGYTPFRIDLTDEAQFNAENLLTVYVDSHERDDIPPFGFVVDYLTYGGIYREVSLEYTHETHIETVGIKTKDVLTDTALLEIDLYMFNQSRSNQELTCRFELIHKDESVLSFNKIINLSSCLNECLNIEQEVSNIRLWDINHPDLYYLKISLMEDDLCIDSHLIRFGFRDIQFKNSGFYLNGKKVKIQGLNRHQSFPYVGYAMPKSAQYKDAEILKYELGVNTVRLSHYPQSNHFMDRCDELGLLVFDEIPGWQHIGGDEWQEVALQNVREMILKDMNHPSVIIWGVRINESQDHDELYEKTNALARSLDHSRPTGGVRCIKKSNLLEDVYTYNDFIHTGRNQGLDKKKKVTSADKPYLITEYNGHMFPTKKFDNESHRVDHALRHLNVIEDMKKDDQISGAIGWCMFDYNTHKDFGSGDKICYHGVLDMFRIPKDAAFVYQSQQELNPVMHVASSLNIGEFEASLLEDIHIFTNCEYVKFYKNGQFVRNFYPRFDKYPHVAHPPVIIDDFIGDAIEKNEVFSPSDAVIVKNLLTSVSKNGENLGLLDTLKMGWIFLKYKMNARDAEDLFTKYFGGWGGSATDYVFEGYIKDNCVSKISKNQVFSPRLMAVSDSDSLVEDVTYDTNRILVKLLDDSGNDIIYGHDAISIDTDGPVKVIGPKVLSLIGGSVGFWIKTIGESGTGRVIIKSERFGVIEKNFTVTKTEFVPLEKD
jgi:beta-galactosidase